MKILGISAFYHDSAACLVVNGRIVSAAQEERFSRIKHDSNFPYYASKYCLDSQNILSTELDYVVFYDKPFLKFDRLLETYLAFAPRGFKLFSKSLPIWLKDKLFQKNQLIRSLTNTFGNNVDWYSKLLFSEHHLSHAASAFFPSPFERAAILTMDGVGEWATTSLALGNSNNLEILKQINFPHSLGLLYSAITYYTGFKVNSGEYKVMGLAPYGVPRYADLIKDTLIEIADDGSYRLDMSYFDYCTGLEMTNEKFSKLFKGGPRAPESDITQREMDLAASIQSVAEEVVLKLCKNIANETGEENLCLAGGVALNCVANGKILQSGYFKNIWIQPAAGDAGGAIGAALGAYYMHLKNPRDLPTATISTSYFGPEYTDIQIKSVLDDIGAIYTFVDEDFLVKNTAELIANGAAIGWYQGRMEFGPRALGGRSILADPRSPTMQRQLNLKVKFRESFRPFAPSVLQEKVADWFEFNGDSPFMLMVAKVKSDKRLFNAALDQEETRLSHINIPRSQVPAVTHIDFSARIQTVTQENGRFYKLIKEFEKITGCPMLINTSFNVRGEPIVESPLDAYKCFMGTDLDYLIIGNFILNKGDQPASNRSSYLHIYTLD